MLKTERVWCVVAWWCGVLWLGGVVCYGLVVWCEKF